MSMMKLGRAGRTALGVVTVVAACKPTSIVLEHEGSAGEAGAPTEAGGNGGANQGSAGESSSGTAGAPLGGVGGTPAAGGNESGGEADQAAGQGAGGFGATCGDRVLSDVRNGLDLLPGYSTPPDPRVETLVSGMSLAEQVGQMMGVPKALSPDYRDLCRSDDVALEDGSIVRGFRYRFGSRGVSLDPGQIDRPDGDNFSTAFPAQSIRGASWDLELEWRIGAATGDETVASKNNLVIGPNVDLVRHPYWGRTQDSYGEDTYHVGRMASAFIAGAQSYVGACAPHFAANTIELDRANQDAIIDEQTLREIYGRPFEMAVRDGGVACVMAAYNKVNGIKAVQHRHLLRDILKAPVDRGGFGFRGFVMSDWWAAPGDQYGVNEVPPLDEAVKMAEAGLDVEVPWQLLYSRLAEAVTLELLEPAVIGEAAARVVEQKARFDSVLTTDPLGLKPARSTLDQDSIATSSEHLALAERSALESAVLLHNGSAGSPVLPVPNSVGSIAVIGAERSYQLRDTSYPSGCAPPCSFDFATTVALGDRGSYRVDADPAESIGPFAGIQAAATNHGVASVSAGNEAAAAAGADFVVVVVGMTPGDEGEEYAIASGGDRATLELPGGQAALVAEVLDLAKPTVIVVVSGSVVNLPWLSHRNQNQATVWAGYAGMRGGAALGKLLFADANFSGKLPLAWPLQTELDVQTFQETPTATTHGYFFGYREYDRRALAGYDVALQFPFGHGLSYTTFAYSNLVVPCSDVSKNAVVDVSVDVENTGAFDADEVVFLFVAGPPASDGQRSVKELKSFARVSLTAGERRNVKLPVRIQDLRHWSETTDSWVVDSGDYTVLVGPSAASEALAHASTFRVAD